MKFSILLFAAAAEAAGTRQLELSFADSTFVTIVDIKRELQNISPELSAMVEHAWFAVNNEYANLSDRVTEQDQIAVIPPVSGGETTDGLDETKIALTHEPLSLSRLYESLLRFEAGAVVVFSGIVRGLTDDKVTQYLEYEAFEEMAIKKMSELVKECEAKFPGVIVYIWHRIGHMEPTESSVLIGVSSPHREAAFAAGKYAIDELKQRVPIWKKEFYQDGEIEWAKNEHWQPVRPPKDDLR